jgi:hypothetical protein
LRHELLERQPLPLSLLGKATIADAIDAQLNWTVRKA